MSFEVRRVVTGYDDAGNLTISSDTAIAAAGPSPAGKACSIWTAPAGPAALDDGPHAGSGAVRWYCVMVPPDKERGAAENDYPAGLLHEGDTVDLGVVVAGEVWLELEGVAEWVHLRAGDTLVQRGTKHAWHNPTDTPAYLSCVILPAARGENTPSRLKADDPIFHARASFGERRG